MTAEKLADLRKPFPAGTVGKLPKLTCSACAKKQCQVHSKSKCRECDAYISAAHIHLDFVGHAAVTDRLLNVDPLWTWEPIAFDDQGNPTLDREGNFWIRLTVCGISRLGVGDGPNMKERIGDAIRNAAMRYGVALSLWSKDELESGHTEVNDTPAEHNHAEQPQLPPTPGGMVDPGTAKNRLLKAFGGDVKAMNAAWGTRGHNLISEDELAGLEEQARQEDPA